MIRRIVIIIFELFRISLMKQILQTSRLLLREFTPDDAESFYRLNSNPNVIRYTGDAAFETVDAAKMFLESYSDYQLNGYGRWAVLNKTNSEFLGWCGLKYDARLKETDIGFRFFEEYWNKGYATESAKACINYGFEQLGLTEIIGRAMTSNIASIRVLEKIGLVFEKEFDFTSHDRGVIYKVTDTLKGEL